VIENEIRFRTKSASTAGKQKLEWLFLLIYREKWVNGQRTLKMATQVVKNLNFAVGV